MESNPPQPNSGDSSSALAAADRARQRLASGLRLPTTMHPALAGAVAVQLGTAAYGISSQTTVGLEVALAGVAIFLGVAALLLRQFRRVNGVTVAGLASQIVLGTGVIATVSYVAAFGAATWAAFDSHWLLVGAAAVAGGLGYTAGAERWWHAYQHDPAGNVDGASARVLALLAAVACVGLVALLIGS